MSFPVIPINSLVSGYKSAMDWLHQSTSRSITVFVQPMKTGCPNGSGFDPILKQSFPIYNTGNPFSQTIPTIISSFSISGILNIPFSGGNACPICQNEGFLFSPSSGIILARIQWRNELTDFNVEEAKLQSSDFKVRVKITGEADFALMDRAIRVIIDGRDCRMIEQGISVGLRDIHTRYYYFNDLQ